MIKKKQEGKFNMGIVCPFATYEKFTLSVIARILKKYSKYAKMQQSNRVTGWVDLYSL